ncbi:MAG TPA: hypothetical protein VFM38_13255, partial [Candidatus Limnocylindrales bacterium]|nr:hypothetical protein [Candidatus Limnocylindrales bacterium]
MNELSHGAKIVLGATIAFLIVSFFSWFHYTGPGKDELEAIGADTGITMWHGVGWIAGLLAIVLLVWQAIRLANIEFEIGVTPSMITAALSVLVLIFALIRWLDKPGGDFVGRTFWSWLGLIFAIVMVVGAWMNMRAAGDSLTGIRDQLAGATAGVRGADRSDTIAPTPPATPPATTTPPASPETPPVEDPD